MSDLQISLLVIGVVVVAIVYLFNWRQERAFRRKAEQAFTRDHADVLLQEAATPDAAPQARMEPSLPAASALSAVRGVLQAPGASHIDSVIDYVVEVRLPQPHDGADLRAELLALSADWGKPVQVAGCDSASSEWQYAGDKQFAHLRFALQMCNRGGCVEQRHLEAFRDAVLGWAARLQADADCPDVREAHARAVELDRFCVDADIAIGINVVASDGNPFSGTKIRALAEAGGMKLEPEGAFYARNEHGDVLFTLDNHEPTPFVPEQVKSVSTRGITFLLDVPRVSAADDAFDVMLETARGFAATLGGVLVDDNRAALSEAAIDKIRGQLRAILAQMEAGHIAPGGARALRLFR